MPAPEGPVPRPHDAPGVLAAQAALTDRLIRTLLERGHEVHLYEASAEIGGQLNMAKAVPGKEEFNETVRYYTRMLQVHRVDVRLGARADGMVEVIAGLAPGETIAADPVAAVQALVAARKGGN